MRLCGIEPKKANRPKSELPRPAPLVDRRTARPSTTTRTKGCLTVPTVASFGRPMHGLDPRYIYIFVAGFFRIGCHAKDGVPDDGGSLSVGESDL